MKKTIKTSLVAISAFLTLGCESNFSGGGSGRKGFSGGGGNVQPQPQGPNVNGQGTQNGLPRGVDQGSGQQPGFGGIGTGGGVITAHYGNAKLTVLRRDTDGGDKYDHSEVKIGYQVRGAAVVEKGILPANGESIEIPRACPKNEPVSAKIWFELAGGLQIFPTLNTAVGGPIGFRLSAIAILVAMEMEANGNPKQTAWHNNDDLVVMITCEGSTRLNAPEICFDQRIPWPNCDAKIRAACSDLVTDAEVLSGDARGRMCTST